MEPLPADLALWRVLVDPAIIRIFVCPLWQYQTPMHTTKQSLLASALLTCMARLLQAYVRLDAVPIIKMMRCPVNTALLCHQALPDPAQDLDAPDDRTAAAGTRSKLRLCFGLEPGAGALVLGRTLRVSPLH